jgi:energy-coupling factor transporter ATP-binding protein EcfA2
MRLRYVHFPRCGPLVDIAIAFDQETMFFGQGKDNQEHRKGSINFIVGVNGTGKSTLLRALYQTFRALRSRERPPHPVTLAWDWDDGQQLVTAIFHYPPTPKAEPFFARVRDVMKEKTADEWRRRVNDIEIRNLWTDNMLVERGPDVLKSPLVESHTPRKLVAYTSGDQLLWTQLEHQRLQADKTDELRDSGDIEDDRPPGWDIDREWHEDVSRVVGEIIDRHKDHIPSPDDTPDATFGSAWLRRVRSCAERLGAGRWLLRSQARAISWMPGVMAMVSQRSQTKT